MPIYRERLAREFEEKQDEIAESSFENEEVSSDFREAFRRLISEYNREDIERMLSDMKLPGALPTREYQENQTGIFTFGESEEWNSHEAVNRWARDQIKGVTTVAVDGSQINPVTEFEKPVGFVQVVGISNEHTRDREYEREVMTEFLTPNDILFEDPNTGQVQVDDQKVPATRFRTEMKMLEQNIEKVSSKDTVPVVFYDGSMILSFISQFDGPTQDRYGKAMARVLSASRHYRVPVVGYVSGSRATEVGKMIRNLDLLKGNKTVRDYRFLKDMMKNWGDRTILFKSRRDNTLCKLRTSFKGQDYNFSDHLLFAYLNTGLGSQLDRIEMPEWILEEGLAKRVISVVRAECGIGRGYPEILQSADADAVISHRDRERFLRICQNFAEENNIDLEWNNKSLSKRLRRR
ncbi:MAG: DNA double-strand break repair nuclease NurA [Candidatus Hadarchaeia archaeon]